VVYFPNAFTPESGRGNNYFYPKGVGADTQGYKMTIYDRWGEPIFETTDLPTGFNERYEVEGGWNGRYRNKGAVVQNGVYTWVVQIRDVNGINHEYSGTVTVIR
jgi:gliding motility-associated-like protein